MMYCEEKGTNNCFSNSINIMQMTLIVTLKIKNAVYING